MRARRLVHRGHVMANGLLLVRDAERRALRLFTPGVRLARVQEGLLLHFPSPRTLRADCAWGHPLVELHGRLCTAPLQEDEVQGQPPGVLLVRRGEVLNLGSGVAVDAADWLDLGLRVCTVHSLGHPPPPPQAAPETAKQTRGVFADLMGEQPGVVDDLLSGLGRGAAATGAFSAAAMSWMQGMRGLIGNVEGSGAGEGWLDKVDGWLAQQMVDMGMGSLLSAAHSRFLNQLLADFERGSLEEALKRAIPLGGEGGLAARLAGLLMPSRGGLGFSGPGGGAASVIPVGEGLMERLKELYRRALKTLEEQGRIDEAAYVLAELLGEAAEAVALLERHERWARAAELAEVKELDPELAVRCWFLAGEVDRAILAARRRGGMDGALKRLQDRDPAPARRLRVVWAGSLAASGRYAAAVELLRELPGAERVVERWLQAAIEGGGQGGAKALALALERRPQAWEELYDTALPWLDGPSHRSLNELTDALVARSSEASVPLLRHATRRLIQRRAEHGASPVLDKRMTEAAQAGGGALALDLPKGPVKVSPLLATVRERLITLPDAGAGSVSAVRWLPRQRLLVARGEAGVELHSADGRLLRRWEQPAHDLAVHEEGTLAIGLAERGSLKRLCRLDLTSGAGSHWCEAAISGFRSSFIDPWIVAGDCEVMGIDVAHAEWRRTWRLGLKTPVQALSGSAQVEYVAEDTVWSHRLPDLGLDRRKELGLPRLVGKATPHLLAVEGGAVDVIVNGPEGWFHQHEQGRGVLLAEEPTQLLVAGPWVTIVSGSTVRLLLRHQDIVRLRVELPGGRPRAWLGLQELVVWDDLGRVLVLDLERGETLAELRI